MPRARRNLVPPAALGLVAAGLLAGAAAPACSSGDGGTGGAMPGGTGGAAHTASSTAASSASSGTGGVAGTGGTGGTAGGGGCAPGDVQPCYTGPPGTEGIGACIAGTKTCDPTGAAFGPCTGEVVPKPESCFTPVDDNCDGQINEGCLCTPGMDTACYTGPSGTEGVGDCHGGMQVCDLMGTGYGPCDGEVTPQVENCVTPADEDCDGTTPPCSGAHVLAEAWGGPLDEEGLAVATDVAGDILIGGYTVGAVDFGCGPLAGGAGQGALVLKLDPAGNCLWSHRYQDGSVVTGIAADVGGDVYVTGQFTGVLDLGGGPLASQGGSDVFFAELDAGGGFVWAKRFGDAAGQTATGLAVDEPGAGNLAGVGYFQGSIDFGGGAHVSQGGNDVYVVRLDGAGGYVWSKSFGDPGNQIGRAVAIDSAYNTLIAGSLSGSVDFGGGALTSAGLDDAFVARFDPTGGHVCERIFGDAGSQGAFAVRTDSLDNVFVAGAFDGSIDFGGAQYGSLGGQDAWLLSLDLGGSYRWSRQIGGPNTQLGSSLAVDVFGNVAFGGVLAGTADLGGGPLTSAGTTDVMVGKYDPAGNHLWSYRFGDAAAQTLEGLAFTPSDELLLTGILMGPTDFGGGPVIGGGGEDLFVAGLAP